MWNKCLIGFWLSAQAANCRFDETEGKGDNGSRLLAEFLVIYLLGRVDSEKIRNFYKHWSSLWGLHTFCPTGFKNALSSLLNKK